jgi:hypothetical protein
MDFGGRDGQRLPVALAQFLEPLKEPAVDQNPDAGGVEEVLRAGDSSRGSQEG